MYESLTLINPQCVPLLPDDKHSRALLPLPNTLSYIILYELIVDCHGVKFSALINTTIKSEQL